MRIVTVDEAQQDLAELIEDTQRTGEPVIIGQEDAPLAALVSAADFLEVKRLREQARWMEEFRRSPMQPANHDADLGPTEEEEEIVRAVKATREAMYRERYGWG
jgi:prevent-host-death family protein